MFWIWHRSHLRGPGDAPKSKVLFMLYHWILILAGARYLWLGLSEWLFRNMMAIIDNLLLQISSLFIGLFIPSRRLNVSGIWRQVVRVVCGKTRCRKSIVIIAFSSWMAGYHETCQPKQAPHRPTYEQYTIIVLLLLRVSVRARSRLRR